MKTDKITPSEYAAARGITLQAVTKAIRQQGSLPGVRAIEKYGRFYLLTVFRGKDNQLIINEIEKGKK